jgi:CXXX repeat modification system protein
MAKKAIGKVSETEKEEIRLLFERKNALTELFQTVNPDNEALYDRIVADMGKTSAKFQSWWDGKAQQYEWESVQGYKWEIDFNDGTIYLVENCK